MKRIRWRRRDFLAGMLGSGCALFSGCRARARLVSATGQAFGTSVGIRFLPESGTDSDSLVVEVFREIARLESIFTLYDPNSWLRRLNDRDVVEQPPPELVAVLRLSEEVHRLTGGAFDPTVQPLWELFERHFATNPLDRAGPPADAVKRARELVDWKKVEVSDGRVRFRRAGMKLTLNGIAPGFAADAIAELLVRRGIRHALVDCGEFRAVGDEPGGESWEVAIRGVDPDAEPLGRWPLDGNGLATSAGFATSFDVAERFHHLFHPRRDEFSPARQTISVVAPTAALADGLATAGGVMEWEDFSSRLSDLPGVRVRRWREDSSS